MEIKAYVEGILRKWWLLAAILVISFGFGKGIVNNQTAQYTASTTIMINEPLLAQMAIPSNVVQIDSQEFASQVTSPAITQIISKHYPRLNAIALEKLITVSTDASKQLLYISFTDISPESSTDIVNYLALKFVQKAKSNVKQQLDYYEGWLKQTIAQLTQQINSLNLEIQNLPSSGTSNRRDIRRTIVLDDYQLSLDESNLYNDQEALKNLLNTRALFSKAYVILQPASINDVLTSTPTSSTLIVLVALVLGLVLGISFIITIEYLTPVIRHKGELVRIVGFSVLAELPKIPLSARKHAVQTRPLLFPGRLKRIRLLSASIGALLARDKGHVLLLTSPVKKRSFGALLATFVARNGHKVLLIDGEFENPRLHTQFKLTGPCDTITQSGLPLAFISKTQDPNLFVLSAGAAGKKDGRLTSLGLAEILPELQNTFNLIIIDAPPLNQADTHLLAVKASRVVLLVKKRRDSIKALKSAHKQCQALKLNVQSLLLT